MGSSNVGTNDFPRICIVQPNPCSPTETFLRAHADHLPGCVAVIAGSPAIGGRPLMPTGIGARAWRKLVRLALGRSWYDELTAAYLTVFRHHRPDAVLAEYGGMGVMLMDACRRAGLPLIAHFHGFDATQRAALEQMEDGYRQLFREAAALVVVSRAMRQRLMDLGAPLEKIHWIPYGVDGRAFGGSDPASAPPIFLAVGWFCERKAPNLTLRAFARVHQGRPDARLRMVGDGPLLRTCQELARELGVVDAVTFLGVQPPNIVQDEMRRARCFVQHSVITTDGEAEGTPVAILEAGASGLPVVSTRHEGILDAVVEGETGFLVEEHDIAAMAERMQRFAADPVLAGEMGRRARAWIDAEFSLPKQIGKLWDIICSCCSRDGALAPPSRMVTSI
jgi:glycosyltransferase involved in cell wall biosynthesis